MLDKMQNCPLTLLIGRILLGFIYAYGGFKIFTGDVPVDYAASAGLPAWLTWLGFLVKFFGGIGVITGFWTRLSALALVVFTVLTAFLFHDLMGAVFLKEMAMVGGLLVLATTDAGKYSIDSYLQKDRQDQAD